MGNIIGKNNIKLCKTCKSRTYKNFDWCYHHCLEHSNYCAKKHREKIDYAKYKIIKSIVDRYPDHFNPDQPVF